jgi:site-specific DNA-methyltransferase (adenine-specific)
MKSVWRMTSPSRSEKMLGKHRTQKPVALIERCLLASTPEGAVVLDPFMGSGTTGVACLRNQRQFVGVDSDKESFVLARRRLQHEQNEREDLLGRLGV